jgi:hypothetical protein
MDANENIEKKLDELLEAVLVMRDKMVTKEDLDEAVQNINDALSMKLGGLNRRMDEELDRRKVMEARLASVEHVKEDAA